MAFVGQYCLDQGKSFHLRPVAITASGLQIMAAKDALLLIREKNCKDLADRWRHPLFHYYIASTEHYGQEEGLLTHSAALPPEMISRGSWHCCFLDSFTLCFLENDNFSNGRNLIVFHAASGFFKAKPERKVYRIMLDEDVWPQDMTINSDRLAVIIFTKINTVGENIVEDIMECSFKVPAWTSVSECVQAELRHVSNVAYPPESKVLFAKTNGRMIVLHIHQERSCTNTCSIYDKTTGKMHTISRKDLTWDANLGCFHNDSVLFYTTTRLSIVCPRGDHLNVVHHSMTLPSIPNIKLMLNQISFFQSGDRFFVHLDSTVLMGFVPGADIALENIGAAHLWRRVLCHAQSTLLSRGHITNRDLILFAMKEEQNRETKSKSLSPLSEPPSAKICR